MFLRFPPKRVIHRFLSLHPPPVLGLQPHPVTTHTNTQTHTHTHTNGIAPSITHNAAAGQHTHTHAQIKKKTTPPQTQKQGNLQMPSWLAGPADRGCSCLLLLLCAGRCGRRRESVMELKAQKNPFQHAEFVHHHNNTIQRDTRSRGCVRHRRDTGHQHQHGASAVFTVSHSHTTQRARQGSNLSWLLVVSSHTQREESRKILFDLRKKKKNCFFPSNIFFFFRAAAPEKIGGFHKFQNVYPHIL